MTGDRSGDSRADGPSGVTENGDGTLRPARPDAEAAPPPRVEGAWLDDRAAREVLGALAAGGAKALFVGGCVRDALMGRPVGDLDMATDAPPEEVRRLLTEAGIRTVPTGIEHGTVTAVLANRGYEITSFRRDVETHGRHATVAFGADLTEDASRRDFTMNALYADAEGVVTDPLGTGLRDIGLRRVRFIGDPVARIREDYLRILRFFRFHALYGDAWRGIDEDGLAACAAEADGVETLAKERIGAEMRKLLGAEDPGPALCAMAACGVLGRVLPGADAQAIAPLAAIEARAAPLPDWKRRLLAMGVDPQEAVDLLRLSRADLRALEATRRAMESDAPVAQLAYRHGAEAARDAALLRAAATGCPPPRTLTRDVARGATATFPVQAQDLVARGMKPGPALGKRLAALEDQWVRSDFRATKGEMLDA
ncbi:CCA tRNA nucleotidyltransferase [Albimonas sp. CAU 1670]|uniref:CCA tRNA nucleotidyltransferase n=1 Tax=Albimonas sp. CAU 1670 TaxID=3032599 RepID=UPI0023DAA27F|nr:CCA tRNA nucleotidyltransferase [Albimonas sp. CAU 1670]MDF2231358.1 CCA tRNA nucleotidyltransferase [Albimonas sp. CAU 1670]